MFANATINSYYLIDFCERDARTRQLASMRLTQARPNYYHCYDIKIYCTLHGRIKGTKCALFSIECKGAVRKKAQL